MIHNQFYQSFQKGEKELKLKVHLAQGSQTCGPHGKTLWPSPEKKI